MEYIIDHMKKDDWEKMSHIYNKGIESGISTFLREVPTFQSWNEKQVKNCSFVARSAGDILGWASLSKTDNRCAYTGVAEISIYIDDNYKKMGIGSALLDALIKQSETEGYWTLQSSIIALNEASLALHKKCGFRVIGRREKIAKDKNNQWQDTIIVEKRSKLVGI